MQKFRHVIFIYPLISWALKQKRSSLCVHEPLMTMPFSLSSSTEPPCGLGTLTSEGEGQWEVETERRHNYDTKDDNRVTQSIAAVFTTDMHPQEGVPVSHPPRMLPCQLICRSFWQPDNQPVTHSVGLSWWWEFECVTMTYLYQSLILINQSAGYSEIPRVGQSFRDGHVAKLEEATLLSFLVLGVLSKATKTVGNNRQAEHQWLPIMSLTCNKCSAA